MEEITDYRMKVKSCVHSNRSFLEIVTFGQKSSFEWFVEHIKGETFK